VVETECRRGPNIDVSAGHCSVIRLYSTNGYHDSHFTFTGYESLLVRGRIGYLAVELPPIISV